MDDDEIKELADAGGKAGAPLDQLWDLTDRDNDHEFYRLTFTGKEHWNFLSTSGDVPSLKGPMAVSIIRTGDFYTALVRTTYGCERREELCSATMEGALDRLLRRGHNPKAVLRSLCPELRENVDLNAMELFATAEDDDRIPSLLLTLHDRQRVTGFKFGVLYAKRHQYRESEFFSNTSTSAQFDEFLSFLGEKIELDGWEGFRGGLDVRSGSTGKHAVYTEYNPGKCPILFHVSTYLPFDSNNDQQLERKRHIGNDLVVIVFQDSSETPFRPAEVSSRMIHVIVVVRPVKFADRPDETWYRVAVVSKNDTPAFAPVFENVTLFKKGAAFRELLLQKLLNAERACYAAPILKKKMEKTRNVLLADCIRQVKSEVRK